MRHHICLLAVGGFKVYRAATIHKLGNHPGSQVAFLLRQSDEDVAIYSQL